MAHLQVSLGWEEAAEEAEDGALPCSRLPALPLGARKHSEGHWSRAAALLSCVRACVCLCICGGVLLSSTPVARLLLTYPELQFALQVGRAAQLYQGFFGFVFYQSS